MNKQVPDVTRNYVVLIADDDDAIRNAMRRTLRRGGYAVVEVRNGRDALALLNKKLPVDLLIADLQIPHVGGYEMARRGRLMRPDLKVLYVSGCVDRLFESRSQLWKNEAFLEKPFTRQDLLSAAALLLRGRGDAVCESAASDT